MLIAILCRPGDAPGYGLRIRAQLQALAPGATVALEATPHADVLLAVVGPNWASPATDEGTVNAISAALRDGRQIIPVLVQGGRMPAALPASIRAFATINACSLHNDAFASGVEALLEQITNAGGQGPWRDADVSGTIRIVSKNPGMLFRAVSVIDGESAVNVRIDGTMHGSMHLYGDEMTIPVAPGRHEILLRHRWEDPVVVDVPANGTVVLTATRNVLTGAVTVTHAASK
jgi:hypothetical protein